LLAKQGQTLDGSSSSSSSSTGAFSVTQQPLLLQTLASLLLLLLPPLGKSSRLDSLVISTANRALLMKQMVLSS
jgi:hypothetical protein